MMAFTPRPAWAVMELLVAIAIAGLGLAGYITFSSIPWMLLAAAVFMVWRGPGWRALGMRRPPRLAPIVALGVLTGIGYQFLGLYLVEPLIARVTGAGLPDVSAFRPLVGDETRLAFWLALSWTLAAFMEELVFRGWIMARLAELGRFTPAAWLAAAAGSSLIFGAVHLYQGPSGVLATAMTGAVFAAIYLLTGRNLWGCILAHGTLDTAGFVLIYLGIYPGLQA